MKAGERKRREILRCAQDDGLTADAETKSKASQRRPPERQAAGTNSKTEPESKTEARPSQRRARRSVRPRTRGEVDIVASWGSACCAPTSASDFEMCEG